ncbi:hypothetical protein E4T39_03382 [Aureobasidium subglaciale]|nr:hypothetical protein E4T39_03382 [Aureobasidium subglaciale]
MSKVVVGAVEYALSTSKGDANSETTANSSILAPTGHKTAATDFRPSGIKEINRDHPLLDEGSSTAVKTLTRDGIEADLRTEKPKWPFSAYGPGRDAPIQLFGGYPLEMSPEEMRVMYYEAAASGNPQTAMQAQQELITQSTQQLEKVLGDLDGAVKYVLDGENQHPNRTDSCQAAVGNVFHRGRKLNSKFSGNFAGPAVSQSAQNGVFGQPSAVGNGGAFAQSSNLGGGGGFGQASNLGQKPNPFAQSTSTAPAGGTFGAASALGQKPSPFAQPSAGLFGQPSAMGARPNAFNQPPAAAVGFGQPSGLGQGNVFAKPSGGVQSSPFAQATQPNVQPSPFAQSTQQGGGSFGQASALNQPSAPAQQQNNTFGQSSALGQQPLAAFGQPSVPTQQNSTFGQPSVAGQNQAFGQPSAPAQQNVFGQPSGATQQSNPFGQPSAPAQQNGVFGQPSAPGQQQNVFAKPSPFAPAQGNQQQQPPFGQPAATSNTPGPFAQPTTNNQAFGGAPSQTAPAQAEQQRSYAETVPQGDWITRNANGTVRSFKGAAVQYMASGKEAGSTQEPHYRKADGSMERIWHPEGNPAPKAEIEGPAEAYTAEVQAAYMFVAEQGIFKDGIMPEVPPKSSLQPPTSATGHGVINGLLALIGYLIQLLTSVVYGSAKEDSRREEDADEDMSNEEMVLLGHMCGGLIVVRERRRKRSTAIVLSSSRHAETRSALEHAAAAYHFLAAESHPRLLGCLSSGTPIVLEHASLGNVHALVSSKIEYPSLVHPSIPSKHATLALPLSWLLQTSSALRFLHDQKVTHGAISPSSLFLRSDMSIAIADFTKSTINGHNNGVPTRGPEEFAFPVDALRYDYFDGELSANSQALGLAIDAFDFATLAYTLLLRKKPAWELPTGNGTWALEELHEALDEAAPELGDEIVVGYVARDAWCLVYEEGKIIQEDVVHALLRHGFQVQSDNIIGVRESVKDFAEAYHPSWRFEG